MKWFFCIMLCGIFISLAGCGKSEAMQETNSVILDQNKESITISSAENVMTDSATTGNDADNVTIDNAEEDFTATMYDYEYAGTKSAVKRVEPSDYVSALEYGIEVDSNKDFSEEIVNAVYDAAAKGKYLYFPAGRYYVKNVKIWNTDNVKICGEGEKTIFMTADDAVGEEKWDIAVGLYYCDNCVIRNITFDGNNKKVAGNLSVGVLQLRIDNCKNASVYGCRFQNNNSGNINIVGQAEGLKIFYCDFLNSDCSVVVMPGYITNGFICNNLIDGQEWVWSEPISLYNAPEDDKPNSNVIISGNDIRNHTQGAGGVFITYPSKDIYVQSNYFYRCGAAIGSGSRLQTEDDDRGPWNITCSDNVIDSPTWHGIALLYAEGWTIENNTILNITDGFAIYLDQCHNNEIRNNAIGGSRVFEVDSSENTLSENY